MVGECPCALILYIILINYTIVFLIISHLKSLTWICIPFLI